MTSQAIKHKILCIIPARAGSKRLKGKNTRQFNGKPLIAWTIEEAIKSKHIDRIVVSTDDQAVIDIAEGYPVEVLERPTELAADTSTTIDVITNVCENLKKKSYLPDSIMLLQCTSPLRTIDHIDQAIAVYLQKVREVHSLISVCKAVHPPWWMKKVDENGYLIDFIEYDRQKYTRTQDFPDVYQTNGAIYIAKLNELKKYKGFQTLKTLSYMMDPEVSIDIDTEMDFKFAEFLMRNQNKNN